ncbi:MAG: RNA polymerase factor sigma-54 [Alphaproteobacteria bacterium]|nr:RNA polymerase factor sigma-54 [Alphaproteobacteria bacterium]MDX5369437.1 RNA polymerase factor sigma-54 [Alphaproteobacteria bacterium]MDX5464117.1 RNA polymerase factor sigma-54 [Alphaproteobacteria bacterium]
MSLAPRLEVRQSQQLVMTPQLQQAIKLLQLSNIELAAFVEEELERNPLLERDERGDRADGEADGGDRAEVATRTERADEALGDDSRAYERSEALDGGQENLYGDDTGSDAVPNGGGEGDAFAVNSWSGVGGGRGFDGEDGGFEETLSSEDTLHDHLRKQLSLATRDRQMLLIGELLIDQVDEAGYLREPMEEFALRLGIPTALAEAGLALIQSLEPTGVGARDLKECLVLQLKERDRYDPCMAALLDNLVLLARRDLSQLLKVCGVDMDDLQEMIAEVRALEPKPGRAFGGAPVQPVVPDVFVRESQSGGWLVELNSETLPRVLVNSRYYTQIGRSGLSREDKTYLSDCYQTGNWLVKSLDQRARTILKVATEIVRQQDGFFAYGITELRPLNLKTVAEAVSLHESTVSRVTANKYIGTARGIFEMKYFFTTAIASADGGEALSAESVRHRIRALIDAEPPEAILSDDRIVEILKSEGVDIARRTVAKYREAMRIPSSVQRRRMKAALV